MKIPEDIRRIEDYLLGILLYHPKLLLTEPFDINIFPQRKRVIATMLSQLNTGIVPDPVTIADALPDHSGLLLDLATIQRDSTGSAANYPKLLQDLSRRIVDYRIAKGVKVTLDKIQGGEPVRDSLAELIQKTTAWLSHTNKKFTHTASEMAAIMDGKFKDMLEGADKRQIKTGIPKLDRMYGAMRSPDLVVVGARPSVGKTAYAITVMLNAARMGFRVGFISTEMSKEQVAFRMSSQLSGVDAKKYLDASFSPDDWRKVGDSMKVMETLNIRTCDRSAMKISDVRMQCSAWMVDGGIDFVVIDYLTRIHPDKSKNSQNLDVGGIVTETKDMARQLEIPVMLLAQLNRASTSRADTTPKMSDLRDSGIIEQEADAVMLLHRATKEDKSAKTMIIVDKNRHGQSGMALLVNFDEPTMRWWSE